MKLLIGCSAIYSLQISTAFAQPFETTTTNNNGHLWLCLGLDSGFEGQTTIYFTKVNAKLTPNYTTEITTKNANQSRTNYLLQINGKIF